MIQKLLFGNLLRRVTSSIIIESRQFASETRNNDNSNPRKQKQKRKGLRTFIPEDCPQNPTIVLFPGQGSQFIGMAKSLVDIPAAVDLFEIASEVLGLVSIESKKFQQC